MQQPINDYKFLGLLAVLILVVGLAFVVIRWPQSRHLSFSQHVALRKQSIIYYSLLFCVALPLLLLFFIGWFPPTFNLPIWFNILLITSSVTQIACTFVPEVGGWKTKYYRALAGMSGICLLPALLILFSNRIDAFSRVFVTLGIITMLGVVINATKNKGKPNNLLILQCLYYAAFFIPILTISYL
jgi:hypothetical protein